MSCSTKCFSSSRRARDEWILVRIIVGLLTTKISTFFLKIKPRTPPINPAGLGGEGGALQRVPAGKRSFSHYISFLTERQHGADYDSDGAVVEEMEERYLRKREESAAKAAII